jgi:hypothetical protein
MFPAQSMGISYKQDVFFERFNCIEPSWELNVSSSWSIIADIVWELKSNEPWYQEVDPLHNISFIQKHWQLNLLLKCRYLQMLLGI